MIEQAVLIRRPILDVFDYLMDVENYWRWAPYFLETTLLEKDKHGWPSRFGARVGFTLAASYRTEVTISDVHRGRWISYRAIDPPQTATYSLESTSAGTLLTARHSPWVLPGIDYLGTVVDALSLNYLHSGLNSLKALVEARPINTPSVVFLSYRRESAGYVVGRVVERLSREFGERSVFHDITSIHVGGAWKEEIKKALGHCAVALIVVNDRWLEEFTRRAKNDHEDVLRIEVTSALASKKLVIPVALAGVDPDKVLRQEFPPDLAKLKKLQWQRLRYDPEFEGDMDRIVESIWKEVMKRGPGERVATTGQSPPRSTDPQWGSGLDMMRTFSEGASAMMQQFLRFVPPPADLSDQ